MALVPLSGVYGQRLNTVTGAIHLVSIAFDDTETDLGEIVQAAANTLLGTIDGDTGTIKTNTDSLVTGGGGGYVRQDSTATIAKETGGNLATLLAALSPPAQATVGTGTVATTWDNGGDNGIAFNGVVTLPYFIDVALSVDTYIALDTAATQFAGTTGAWYAGGLTHRIPCRGKTHVHHKRVGTADGTIFVSVYGAIA